MFKFLAIKLGPMMAIVWLLNQAIKQVYRGEAVMSTQVQNYD